jgi:polyisoprenoid-binding protein YceI
MKIILGLFCVCLAISLAQLPSKAPAKPADAPAEVPAGAPTDHPKGLANYYFGANPARTRISFESKTNVTNILGQSNDCTGSAAIDFDAGKGSCHLVVRTLSLNSGMDDRDRAMHGRVWLDAKANPTIEFKSTSATPKGDDLWKIDGEFLFRGVKRPLSVEAEVSKTPPDIGKYLGAGAWIRVRTSFKIDITQHGITIDKSAQFTVEPVWTVTIDLDATTTAPAGAPAALPDPSAEDDGPKIVRVPRLTSDGLPGLKYEFGKKPQLTTLRAVSETPAEIITTTINAIHGFVGLDKEKGLAGARLHIPVAQLKTGIKERDEHLRGPDWLDAKTHPMIYFETTKAVRKDPKTWAVEGTFKMKGVSKPVAVDLTIEDLPAEDVKKANWGDKPGLRITGGFAIKLSDYGIAVPQPAVGKVSDTLKITLFIIGLLSEQP